MFDPSLPNTVMPDADQPVLDASALSQLRSLDSTGSGGFLRKVLETYLRSLDKQVETATAAHRGQQWDELSRAAHSLKSASASVGALRLSRVCERIEHALRRADASRIDTDMAEFIAETQRVRRAVSEQLGALNA